MGKKPLYNRPIAGPHRDCSWASAMCTELQQIGRIVVRKRKRLEDNRIY